MFEADSLLAPGWDELHALGVDELGERRIEVVAPQTVLQRSERLPEGGGVEGLVDVDHAPQRPGRDGEGGGEPAEAVADQRRSLQPERLQQVQDGADLTEQVRPVPRQHPLDLHPRPG